MAYSIREQLHADVGVMYVIGNLWPSAIGRTDSPQTPTQSECFAVATRFWYTARVTAHEIAHILGAAHVNEQGIFRYSAGHQVVDPWFQTIMHGDNGSGYAVEFFSNPSISWWGNPLGVAGCADNAKTLRQTVGIVNTWGGTGASGTFQLLDAEGEPVALFTETGLLKIKGTAHAQADEADLANDVNGKDFIVKDGEVHLLRISSLTGDLFVKGMIQKSPMRVSTRGFRLQTSASYSAVGVSKSGGNLFVSQPLIQNADL